MKIPTESVLQEAKNRRASSRAKTISNGLVAAFLSLLPALADSPVTSNLSVARSSAQISFLTVNRLGESDQQAALRDRQLFSHRRTVDPFGINIRGPFKGLPPIVIHPAVDSAKPAATAAAVHEPTLEKAVQELSIGGVNVAAHEILVGSRSIREGDLLVLESGLRQFPVWVESVEFRGVYFSDIDLQKHILKPFGAAPKELPSGAGPKGLPGNSDWGISDLHQFLNKDSSP